MDQKIVVRPYEQFSGHSYISDLGFKAYLDLFGFEVEHIQYEPNRQDRKRSNVIFVYDIDPEEMREHVRDYFNSDFSRFKMFEDRGKTIVHNVMQPLLGE
jgi:sulfite reductase beta subunit-like hemoprotein